MTAIKRVAVVGAGPAGAITVDALAQEGVFDVIRVFERREKPGGCWLEDSKDVVHQLPDFGKIADRTADEPSEIPENLPTYTPKSSRYRFFDTSIYPALEANIVAKVMEFSQEPIPEVRSSNTIRRHGPNSPFRHHTVIQQYITSLVDRKDYPKLVKYSTTVERIEKLEQKNEWRLTLREEVPSSDKDYWWTEDFDAVVVASGHYNVPFIPHIEGLAEFAKAYPGCVEHSKSFRDPYKYEGKRVIVVGASISGPDIAAVLAGVSESPLHAVERGRYHPYFGDWAFRNPHIKRHSSITHISSSDGDRTVHFDDGTSLANVDHIILGTGYSWTLPFLPDAAIRNNRVPDLYLHIFKRQDPTLTFVGAVAAGFTFKIYEWQAVLAARFLAGRVTLPSTEAQQKWESDRMAVKGDEVPFTLIYPDFEQYFEQVRELAGEPVVDDGGNLRGRPLPKFDKRWREEFEAGHLLRIAAWQKANRDAELELQAKGDEAGPQPAML